MELGIFGRVKHLHEGYIFGFPNTHHKYINLREGKLVVLRDPIQRGEASGYHYHRGEIEEGKYIPTLTNPKVNFKHEDNGPDEAVVALSVAGYGNQRYDAKVTLPGRWEK